MTRTAHDPGQAVYQTICDLERLILPAYPEDRPDLYGYEPYPIVPFIDAVRSTGHPVNRSFLDVGCGIGTKLLLAEYLGFERTVGIERYEPYVEVARKLCPNAEIIHADAFDWDDYGSFDVVYMYRPCVDEEAERRLEQKLIDARPSGWLLMAQPALFNTDMCVRP